MSMKGSMKSNAASEKAKTMRMPRPESKEYFDMIRKNDMPKACAARWRWAVRKVMRSNRIGRNKFELSRLRVVKGASVVDRLVRLESEMFQLPLDMHESIRQKVEEMAQHAQSETDVLRKELEKLKVQLAAQQEKTRNSAFSLSNRIDEVKASCAQLDRTCSDMDRALSKSTGPRNNKQRGSVKHSEKSPVEVVKKSDHMVSDKDKEKEKEKERENEEVVSAKRHSIQFETDAARVADNAPTDQADSSMTKSEKTEIFPKLKREHSSRLDKDKEKSGGSRKDSQVSDSNKSKRKGSEKVEKIDVAGDGDAVGGGVLSSENQSTAGQSEVKPLGDSSALLDFEDDEDIERSASLEGLDADLGPCADNENENDDVDGYGYGPPSREIELDSEYRERVDLELDSLNRRLNCTESTHGKTLQGKVHDLQAEVGTLQDNATMTLKQLMKLKARLNMTPSSSSEISSVGDSVSSLTQLDRDMKDMHRAVWVLESRVTALRDLERGVRGEICHTAAASRKIRGDSSPRAFSTEGAKQELLMLCDEVRERLEGISLSLSDSGTDSLAFSSLFGGQWNTLSSLLNPTHSAQRHQEVPSLSSSTRLPSPTAASSFSSNGTSIAAAGSADNASSGPALDKLRREVEAMKQSKASLEDVRVISRETVTGALAHALGPIRTKMEHLESEIARLKESVSSVSEAAAADREWLQSNAEEMSRRDEELQLKEAERSFREEEQRRRDEEQRKRDIEQRNMQDRRHDEEDQRRRDDDQRRREEEEQRSGEEIQRDHEANGGLPLGIIACLRHDIESAISDCLEEGEEEDVEVEVEDSDVALRAQVSKAPGLTKLRVTSDSIQEGSAVIVIAGDNRGRQGMVVNIRTLPHDEDEDHTSIECVQYLIRLEPNPRSSANSPSKGRKSRPTSAMPRKKDRDRDRDRDGSDEKVPLKNNVEIMKLRDEIQQMEITLRMLGRDKINGHQAQQMIELRTAQVAAGDDKVDNEAFAVVEVAVKNLAIDLDDLRHHQSRRLATVKKQFEESFQAMTVNQSTTAESDTGMFSSVITTGQCLGCGRLSAINHVPPAPSSPETYRAGFKMPLAFTPMGLYPFRAVSPLPLGGSETETARPMSAALVPKNADIAGNQHTTSECMDLSLDSIAPQYRTIRPRTSSTHCTILYCTVPAHRPGDVPCAAAVIFMLSFRALLYSAQLCSTTELHYFLMSTAVTNVCYHIVSCCRWCVQCESAN